MSNVCKTKKMCANRAFCVQPVPLCAKCVQMCACCVQNLVYVCES
jgi:hypothetical protein